ncbi:MAG: metal ABC transporter ATP-binding protein [Phycisphaerales bacterium]|nr:metal ABC transporter ATP-binding protein [Phycisphaerales bacterium]
MTTPDQTQQPAVEIRDVAFSYPPSGIGEQGLEVLRGVTMRVEARSRLGILGPNGGGKSTLIKLILGMLDPSAGSIQVFGKTPNQARREGLIGYLPQRIGADLDWPLSVEQVIAMPLRAKLKPWSKLSDEDRSSIDRAIELLEVDQLRDRRIGALSGGQLQRTMIARAICTRPKLLVLDEPTLGVDIAGQQRFSSLIDTISAELGLTTIVVTHDMRALVAVADRVACLSRTLHFHDTPDGLTPAVLAQVFAHDIEPILGEVHIDAHTAVDCDDPSHAHHPDCGHDHRGGAS